MTRHVAHVFRRGRELHWSGWLASGDPDAARPRRRDRRQPPPPKPAGSPYVSRVDVGREFWIGEDGRLHFVERGECRSFTPAQLVTAARFGLFGLKEVARA
jgi:hypothetical protein